MFQQLLVNYTCKNWANLEKIQFPQKQTNKQMNN